MQSLFREVRLVVRQFARTPAFTVTALLILALGIGATTGMYAVLHATLLRPLPFPDADRMAFVWGVWGPTRDIRGASHAEIMDWRDATMDAFSAMSVYDESELTVSVAGAQAERVLAETVSASYFAMLGVAPHLGRVLMLQDEAPAAAPVAVISHDYWQSRFGGAPDVIGRTMRVGDTTLEVVGVLPPRVHGLSTTADVWTTLAAISSPDALANRGSRWLAAVVRLRDGISDASAQARLDAAAAALERTYPENNRERGAQLLGLREQYLGDTAGLIVVLFSAVGLLFVIAIANVASLLLVRGNARAREFAVRHALGASRRHIVRQLLLETVVLAIAGGVLGIGFAAWSLELLLPLMPEGVLPPYATVAITPGIALSGLLAAALAGAVAGLVPAARGTESSVRARIDEGGRSVHGTRNMLQHVFVAGEVALALVLLVAGGLMLRSFQNQLDIDPGFQPEGISVARFTLPTEAYPVARRPAFLATLENEVRALPGVDAVAFTSDAPLRGGSMAGAVTLPEDPERGIRSYRHMVSGDYFALLGIALVEGRSFSDTDRADAAPVAIVSHAFAQRSWPGQRATGRMIRVGDDAVEVIGVAGSVRQRSLTTDLMDPGEDPDVYFHYEQWSVATLDLLVRSNAPAATMTPAIRSVFRRLDPGIAVTGVEPLGLTLRRETAAGRFGSFLLGSVAILAVVLACAGVYGVLSFLVGLRRTELAVRLALGATPASVRALVLRQGGVVVGAGLAVGLIVALATARLLATYLYGLTPTDTLTFAAVTAVMLLTALAATWIPAQRAARVAPQSAFHQ